VIVSRSVLLTVRNVSDNRFRENQNKCFKLNNFSGKGAVCEKMWKKYGSAKQVTGDNKAYVHFMLDS